MSIVRRIFPSDIDALRPRLACEITPAGVLAARPGSVAEQGLAQDVMTEFVPLRLGVLSPGLKAPAMTDRAVVSAALKAALDSVAERDRKVTVIVPDAVSISTLVSSPEATISWHNSSPDMPGRSLSSSTTSYRVIVAFS